MRRIVDTGLNAVRLPLGHWVLQEPAQGEAFQGPCLDPRIPQGKCMEMLSWHIKALCHYDLQILVMLSFEVNMVNVSKVYSFDTFQVYAHELKPCRVVFCGVAWGPVFVQIPSKLGR